MNTIEKAIRKVEDICLAGSCIALILIMLMLTIDVILRKVSTLSITGAYEITEEYLMVAAVFLSISYVYRIGGHVKVELFERTIPNFLRPILNTVKNLAAFVFFALITAIGFGTAWKAFLHGELSSGALVYPIAPALFLVPLGAGITCLRILQTMYSPHDK